MAKTGIYIYLYKDDLDFVNVVNDSYVYKKKYDRDELEKSYRYLDIDDSVYVYDTLIVLEIVKWDNGVYELFFKREESEEKVPSFVFNTSSYVNKEEFIGELENLTSIYDKGIF